MPGLDATPHEYVSVKGAEEIKKLVSRLKEAGEFTFDTETTSLTPFDTRIVGLSFALEKGRAYWVPVPADDKAAGEILEMFRPVFEDESVGKTGQNLKYDIEVLGCYGIRVKGRLFDTMVAHYLINPESRHGMDILAEQYLGYRPMPYEEMMGREKDIRRVDAQRLKEYAAEDADITLQLKSVFAPKLVEKGAEELFRTLETPLIPVLASMEAAGVRIDTDELSGMAADFRGQLSQIEARIYEQAGEEFNLNSPKQLGDILFRKLSLADQA